MKDFIEASIKVLNDKTRISIDADWVPYIVFSLAMLYVLYQGTKRLRLAIGDTKAVSDELIVATKLISDQTKKSLDVATNQLSALNEELKRSIHSRFESLENVFKSQNDVTIAASDGDVDTDAEVPKLTRRKMAEAVRDTVVTKWLSGTVLARSEGDPNVFRFSGSTLSNNAVVINFQTPYRSSMGSDGRLHYTLEVWIDGYKKLNFEWNTEGDYALRGFKKGEWIEDVTEWNMQGSAQRATSIAA